jgi:ribosomal protein L37AE/L43A
VTAERIWVCPRCSAALQADALRCKECDATFQGKGALKPVELTATMKSKPGPGVGVSFGFQLDE